MSVYISYHSFSPSRADAKWEDLSKIILARKRADERLEKITEAEARKFNEKKAQNLFAELEKNDLFIPWVGYQGSVGTDEYGYGQKEWLMEEKLSYIFSLGVLCHKGVNPRTDPEAGGFIITNFSEIYEKYQGLGNYMESLYYEDKARLKTDFELEEFEKIKDDSIEITPEDAANFFSVEIDDKKEGLKNAIQRVNIEFGSVSVGGIEGDNATVMEDIGTCFDWELADGVPFKKELIDFYQSISGEKITQLVKYFSPGSDKESIDCAQYFIEHYLKALRPVVKDLKEIEDAVFLFEASYNSPDVHPEEQNEKLKKRCEKYLPLIEKLLGR